jgi:hypothetical protein
MEPGPLARRIIGRDRGRRPCRASLGAVLKRTLPPPAPELPPAILWQCCTAAHLDGWVPLRIMAEHMQRWRCWVWVEIQRPVTAAAADDYVRGCPGYVARSLRMLG